MRKVLILTLLTFGGLMVKAQTGGVMEYKPIPLDGKTERSDKPSLTSESSIVDGYYINANSNKPIKVKLKVAETKYGVFVVGCKKLSDYSWADLSEPIKVSKLLPSNPLAEYFEYKAYVTRLQQTVYF